MAPLMPGDREKGRKVMEKSLTPGQRVFRRVRAGRPKNLGFDKPSPLEVVARLFSEIEKAQGVMREEGLDPRNLRWSVYYYLPQYKSIVPPAHPSSANIETTTRGAIKLLEFFDMLREPLFLKIVWSLDPARWEEDSTMTDEYVSDWETLFNAYPLDAAKITAILEEEQRQK